MKTLSIILFLTFMAICAMSQPSTLIRSRVESGGYGAPIIKYGKMNDQSTLYIGGHGGWIINRKFVLGGKGYASVTPADVKESNNLVVGFAAWGLFTEYIIASDKLVHLSIENTTGYGIAYNDVKNYGFEHDAISYTSDGCFFIEPGINIILNLTKMVRIGGGVSYRYVQGLDYDPTAPYGDNGNYVISDTDMDGLSYQFMVKIGVF